MPRKKKSWNQNSISKKLLTRLSVLLTKMKARNNSNKLNVKIRQIVYPL